MGESDWIKQKRRQRAHRLEREWQEEMGHDREWWRVEARRARTDWSSLLRQRVKALGWARAGRPDLKAWLARLRDSQ
jgi:hypothetical protein